MCFPVAHVPVHFFRDCPSLFGESCLLLFTGGHSTPSSEEDRNEILSVGSPPYTGLRVPTLKVLAVSAHHVYLNPVNTLTTDKQLLESIKSTERPTRYKTILFMRLNIKLNMRFYINREGVLYKVTQVQSVCLLL